MTGSDVVQVDLAEGYAVVRLHRPEARNALNAELRTALHRTMSDLDDDPGVGAVVLTGTDPAFCAGLDLKELAAGPGDLGGGFDDSSDLRLPLPAMSTPVIGAVNGVAITGGLELALACDFLVASEQARFADTHARVGIMPGWGLTVLLPQAVGIRRAREMSATGNFVDARTALDWGLVNHVVDHDDLLPTVEALAADIAGNDAAGVARILATYAEGSLMTAGDALALERRVSGEWLARGAPDLEARRRAVTERGRRQV